MKLTWIAVVLLMTSVVHARKPAVEDFVGIESETQELVPSGTEAMFNFSEKVSDYQKNGPAQPVVRYTKPQPKMDAPSSASASFSLWFGIGFVLALPMITWMAMSQHLKKREQAEAPAMSNVTDLAARRAEKQAAKPDDIKKAS